MVTVSQRRSKHLCGHLVGTEHTSNGQFHTAEGVVGATSTKGEMYRNTYMMPWCWHAAEDMAWRRRLDASTAPALLTFEPSNGGTFDGHRSLP